MVSRLILARKLRDCRGAVRLIIARWIVLVLVLAAPAIATAGQVLGLDDRPNLLLIVADDHAAWTLGIDGDPRRATPNLDALARQGTLFSRAYCNSPVCTPSRQSLITGKLPHAIGVTQLPTRLSDDVLTLGEWLRDLKYATAAIGKMHFNGPSKHGFGLRIDTADWEKSLRKRGPRGRDERRPWRPMVDPARVWLNADARAMGLPAESMQSTFFVDRAIEFLMENRARPFALVVSFYEPHSPFHFPDGWAQRFRPGQFSVFPISEADRRQQPEIFASLGEHDVRGIQAAYFASLSFVDSRIGRLIEAVDRMGLTERTLAVYVGDNGYMLGQHGRFEKHCFFEQAVRIPMIMRWPGHIESGRRVRDLVEMVDLMPTVLHLMNLPVPPDLQGIDLVPLLEKRPGASADDVVFSEYLENEEAMVALGPVQVDRLHGPPVAGRRLPDCRAVAAAGALRAALRRTRRPGGDDRREPGTCLCVREGVSSRADARADGDDSRGARAHSAGVVSP